MAYACLGLGPKAGLITSSITFLSTANAARMCNAPVGFADVDPITGNVTIETIKEAVKKANFPVRAITVVHLGGRPCRMDEISDYAKSINAFLIEDACHAPLAKYTDKNRNLYNVGSCSHSDVATFSFHAIKHITTGEGGALMTNLENLAKKSKLFSSHGMIRDPSKMINKDQAKLPWYYEMNNFGFNYRLSDINCALGISQISKLYENNEQRQKVASYYYKYLNDVENIYLPPVLKEDDTEEHAWHLFSP